MLLQTVIELPKQKFRHHTAQFILQVPSLDNRVSVNFQKTTIFGVIFPRNDSYLFHVFEFYQIFSKLVFLHIVCDNPHHLISKVNEDNGHSEVRYAVPQH